MVKLAVVTSYIPWVLALAGLALAQQTTEKKDSTPPPSDQQKKQEEPLFKGKMGYKSSGTAKTSTTLGFNGIDPSGKVDQKMLATTPTTEDQEKVKQMSTAKPSAADLKAFVTQGGLNSK